MSTQDVPVIANYLKRYTENDDGLVFDKKIIL